MTTIAKDSVVAFHYSVATAEGEQVDASQPGEPLTIMIGYENIIPGLEKQMLGKAKGDKFEATVAPAEAYGEHDPELDLAVPSDNFPANIRSQLQPGMRFRGQHPSRPGEDAVFTVVGTEGDTILVSGNHQLAGKTLVFKIEIDSVRAASPEEIAHGHVHGPGGHHH
ncbi:MAG: FKBP-type peptidyl-prolyl cis-trans isomerase SlyD [Planctomycetota bacterium]|jgi:FKBP-type peptidyl-prolyl cis-trans isomerase SlyD